MKIEQTDPFFPSLLRRIEKKMNKPENAFQSLTASQNSRNYLKAILKLKLSKPT